MKDRFKFRAWTKRDKCWCNMFAVHKSGLFAEGDDGWIDLLEQDEIVLMQSTGLKDKNGKLIYEGDLVSSNAHRPCLMEVEFIEGGFCCTSDTMNIPIDINHFYPSTGCQIEIVGNRFEHPKLLT